MAEVGRHCSRLSGSTSPLRAGSPRNRLVRAMSHQFLSISRDGNSTTRSVSGHPYNKKGFSYVSREFTVFPFVLFAFGPVTGNH